MPCALPVGPSKRGHELSIAYRCVTQRIHELRNNLKILSKALLSVYDKTGLLELADGLHKAGVQLLGSGGTAKKIRDSGIPIKYNTIIPEVMSLRV